MPGTPTLTPLPRSRFHPGVTIRALLFDCGGTLDGPGRHWLDRFVDLYRDAGLDVSSECIKAAFYRADEAAYAEPRLAAVGLRELMEFHVGVQFACLGTGEAALQRQLVDRFVADSEAALAASRRVLDRLAARYRLGVVSNFYGNVASILAAADIAPLLAVIVDSTAAGVSKPDARIFARALSVLGVRAGETLHVGDSYERDVRGAHAAGLRTAWLVHTADAMAASDCVADLRVRSLEELADHLERRAGFPRP